MTQRLKTTRVEPNPRVKELTGPLLDAASEVAQRDPSSYARIENRIQRLEERLGLLLLEHQGMADDLLRVYEQLCVVFDVTRKLLTLSNERDVLDLFAESLRLTYPDVVFATARVRDGADEGWVVTGDVDALPAWIERVVGESRAQRRVSVANSGAPVSRAADGAPLYAEEIVVAPVYAGDVFVCALVLWRRSDGGWVQSWQSGEMLLFDSLASFCGDAIRNFRLLQELQQMSMDMVRTLVNAVDQKDPYTSGHSNRVGYYAKLLAKELGFGEDTLRTLEWSALLHDIGKIGIRDDVLKKAGRLTDSEFEHIKEHPLRGYHVVRENPHMRASLDGVLHHHERYDGKGYPDGLKGEAIPLQARIIQIADIFDALTTTRSYRNAFPWRKALKILQDEAGTVVDPHLCSVFVRLMERCAERNPEAFDVLGRTDVCPRLTDDVGPDSRGVPR